MGEEDRRRAELAMYERDMRDEAVNQRVPFAIQEQGGYDDEGDMLRNEYIRERRRAEQDLYRTREDGMQVEQEDDQEE